MKKILILIFVFLTSYQISFSQNISFPDANFKVRLIIEGVDKDSDSEISIDEALQVNRLDITGDWGYPIVSDITGIEFFKKLDTLICSSNSISKIDSLSTLNLKYLDCSWNEIDTMIISLPSLVYLNCNDNYFTFLDVSTYTKLKSLYCNPTDTLILNNPLLEELNVQSNISFDLTNSPSLKTLICRASSPLNLSTNIDLEYFECYSQAGQIEEINVSNNTKLKHLDLWCNLITIDLSSNPELTYVSLKQNDLSSLDVSNNLMLEYLDCSTNELTSLELSNNTNLKEIYCSQNSINTLNINGLSKLIKLSCRHNQLSELDVSDCKLLEFLWFDINKLDTINLQQNSNLVHLNCSKNNLTSLNLSYNINLEVLFCTGNQIEILDLHKNKKLSNLQCHENNLTFLNVNGLSVLEDINGWENQLKSINLNTNKALRSLHLGYNLIDSLDLSHNPDIQVVHINGMTSIEKVCVSKIPITFSAITDNSPNIYFEMCSFTSIDDKHKHEAMFSIYPNPFTNQITIANPYNISLNISISDLSGKHLINSKINDSVYQFDLDFLDKGLYLLIISNSNEVITNKILKW